MLTGESINLAQNLLAKQFPGILGLRDTSPGKMHQFEIIPVDKLCIKLHHAGYMHWVHILNMEASKCYNSTRYVNDRLCKVAFYSYCHKSSISLVTRSVE